MRHVWKFVVPVRGGATHKVHGGGFAPIVFAGLDPATGDPALWIECDPVAAQYERQFRIRGTGEEIGPDERHVGTVIDGGFVWHFYEVVGG